VASSSEVEVETHAGLTIRLVRHEVEARLLPGPRRPSAVRLLDDILTTAPRAQHRRWVVVAVLAFQQSRGVSLTSVEDTAPAEASGAPLNRAQLLAATQELLQSMVATGLAHPSERMLQRLFTLSVSATAVHLPRLSRLLRALSDDVSQVLSRNAAADTGRLFDRLGLTWALARALAAAGPSPPRALAGYHRTEYDPAGDLSLAGVGAYPWQTASGYEGLTVLFWDQVARRFLTWTNSRPTGSPGRFSLANVYRGEAVWTGGGAVERLSRSSFTLGQARTNAQGRLSGSQQTTVAGGAPCDPVQIDFGDRLFTNWEALLRYALATYPLGLTERSPNDRIVVLQPAAWGERVFDELQQSFCWQLDDDAGRSLVLTLPWNGVNETSIEFLEAVKPDRDQLRRVVVRITFTDKGLFLEPLSLLSAGTPQGHRVLNPGFDREYIRSRQSSLLERLRQKYGRDRIATTMTDDEAWDEATDALGLLENAPVGLRNRLTELEGMLLRAAESGLRRLDDEARARLGQMAAGLHRAGLAELAQALDEVERAAASAGPVLWCGYLCRLHRQALGLRQAVGQ
jgi:hypothetical protein